MLFRGRDGSIVVAWISSKLVRSDHGAIDVLSGW